MAQLIDVVVVDEPTEQCSTFEEICVTGRLVRRRPHSQEVSGMAESGSVGPCYCDDVGLGIFHSYCVQSVIGYENLKRIVY